MRYTVQYIPLSKIKPGLSNQMTDRMKELRKAAQDCMHLLIVRKSKKDGGYVLLSGNNHFEYFKKHTNKSTAPCLVAEGKVMKLTTLLHRLRKRNLPYDLPYLKRDQIEVSSWSIIRKFLKQEPRFRNLSRMQQLKVLRLGLQYKKTTVLSMKAKVDQFTKK